MKMTSAKAAKYLKTLKEERDALIRDENKASVFNATSAEDIDAVRPAYDYEMTKGRIDEVEGKIRAVRHALNIFNTTTVVPEMGMTIDALLMYIPYLTDKKAKLVRMTSRLPRERAGGRAFYEQGVVDYTIANYDIDTVKRDLDAVSDELAKAQLALDLVNSTVELDIPV